VRLVSPCERFSRYGLRGRSQKWFAWCHVFLAEEILFYPHAVTRHECLIRIRKEWKRQPEFIDKFLVTSDRIHTHAKNLSTACQFFPGIAQAARLHRAARPIVIRIKIENDTLPP